MRGNFCKNCLIYHIYTVHSFLVNLTIGKSSWHFVYNAVLHLLQMFICQLCVAQGFDPGHDTYQSPPEVSLKIDVIVDPNRFKGNTGINSDIRCVLLLFSANVCSS